MSEQRISTAPVKRLAIERGIDNPWRLASEVGLTYPTARKWWFDEGMKNINANSLIALVQYFQCEPGELFDIVDVVEDEP